jgi:hypothetical protein
VNCGVKSGVFCALAIAPALAMGAAQTPLLDVFKPARIPTSRSAA